MKAWLVSLVYTHDRGLIRESIDIEVTFTDSVKSTPDAAIAYAFRHLRADRGECAPTTSLRSVKAARAEAAGPRSLTSLLWMEKVNGVENIKAVTALVSSCESINE